MEVSLPPTALRRTSDQFAPRSLKACSKCRILINSGCIESWVQHCLIPFVHGSRNLWPNVPYGWLSHSSFNHHTVMLSKIKWPKDYPGKLQPAHLSDLKCYIDSWGTETHKRDWINQCAIIELKSICNAQGKIRLNFRLVFLEDKAQNYNCCSLIYINIYLCFFTSLKTDLGFLYGMGKYRVSVVLEQL